MGYSFADKDNPLVGKRLTGVEIADDNTSIAFTLEDGSIWRADVEGDCCSHSWVEALTVPTGAAEAVVSAIKDSGVVSKSGGNWDEDCVQVYNTSLVTDKGEIIIEYRNESNGYYGGDLRFPVLVS